MDDDMVPSLENICLDYIEETWSVRRYRAISSLPPHLSEMILSKLVSKRLLSDASILLFCGPHRRVLRLCGMISLTRASLRQVTFLCPELRCLDLSDCTQVGNNLVRSVMQNCKRLHTLRLKGCRRVTDDAFLAEECLFQPLSASLCLRSLCLQACPQITDKLLESFVKAFPKIWNLDISLCKKVTNNGVQRLVESLKLKRLNLGFIDGITDDAFCPLLTGYSRPCSKALTELVLTKCQVSDVTLNALCVACVHLQTLGLGWCSGITDAGLSALLRHCSRLNTLDLKNCSLTDESLEVIGAHCPNLIRLNVSWCKSLTDGGIKALATGCPRLVELCLMWCVKITDESVVFAAQNCSQLRRIGMDGCVEISAECREFLKQRRVEVR